MKKNTHERNDLTTGTVWKKLLIFFVPIAAGTIIQQLYNAVDGLIVGRFVGTNALAAVGGSSAQIINVLVGFFVAMTAGASVVIGQIYGAGRKEDLDRAIGNAVTGMTLAGAALMIIGLVASPGLLRMLNTPEETLEGAILYLRIYFLGVPFVMILNMESSILRALGDSLHPFLFMVVGCVMNIVLDALFVIVFGWGVAGVAIATVAAQIVNAGLLTWRLNRGTEEYRLSVRSKTPMTLYGKAKDEVKTINIKSTFDDTLDTIGDGFYSFPMPFIHLEGDTDPIVRASQLPLSRVTPLQTSACDINTDITYLIPKGVKLVGGKINRELSFDGVGSVKISITLKGNKLRLVRNMKVEKSLIPADKYSQYRQLLATWQEIESLLLRSK